MHVSFALFADAANLSQEGKLNILGVFDAVQVGQTPAVHPRAHLVVRLKGAASDAGLHAVALQWINPRGQELWSTTGDIEVSAPPPGVAEIDFPIIASVDLPLDQVGEFTMQISLDHAVQAQVALQVRQGAPAFSPMMGSQPGLVS